MEPEEINVSEHDCPKVVISRKGEKHFLKLEDSAKCVRCRACIPVKEP